MLRFFREKAALFGWGIVIFFGATMFAGSLFLGLDDSERATSQRSASSVSELASLGSYPVDIRRYNQAFQSTLTNAQNQLGRVSPLQLEQVMLMTFKQTLEEQAFYIAALNEEIHLSKMEKKALEKEFLLENKFRSKRELKKVLKERNIPVKQFQKDLDKELLVRKYKNQLVSDIVVDELLIDHSFKTFKFDLLILMQSELGSDRLSDISQQVFTDLSDMSIESVQEKYESVVTVSVVKGEDYRPYLALESTLQSLLAVASVDDYLTPFCREDYCFITRLLDVQVQEKPENYNEEQYSKELLMNLRQRRMQELIGRVFQANPLEINSPDVKAVYLKSQGDFMGALEAYQQLSSNFPSSAVPHFFRADLYQRLGKKEALMNELVKADLKSQLSEANDFPELHIFYGDVFVEEEDTKSAIDQYEKAFPLALTHLDLLTVLKERYENVDYSKGLTEVTELIASIEAEKAAAEKAAKQAAQEGLDSVIEASSTEPVSD